MKLNTYFEHTGKSPDWLAKELSVSREAVRLWLHGQRTPRKQMMARIEAVTGGAVRPMDWYDSGVTEAA